MSAATCEPPEEHQGEPFHWLQCRGRRAEPAEWQSGRWCFCGSGAGYMPESLAEWGYRYVGPAIPPQEGE
jgi:hypothetical protein